MDQGPRTEKYRQRSRQGFTPWQPQNDLVLITREVYSSHCNLLKINRNFATFTQSSLSASAFLLVWPLSHLFISSYTLSASLPVHNPSLSMPKKGSHPKTFKQKFVFKRVRVLWDDLTTTLLLYPSRLLDVTKHHVWRQEDENKEIQITVLSISVKLFIMEPVKKPKVGH